MSSLLLFGATGDLARRMLWPSLYALDVDGLLAADLRIVGTARSALDAAGLRALVADAIAAPVAAGLGDAAAVAACLARLDYVGLDATDMAGYGALRAATGSDGCPVAIFLSTAPSLFGATIAGLAGAGLACDNVRLALEKPLGFDLASSRAINDAVASAFPEDRIFRIDHYLGKETVQNLLALRFANSLFEPLWNASHIDHVQITIAETVGLEGRVDFYDGAGALRDMVQNHMLQLLALVAMEPPGHFGPTSVRDEKVKVLNALRRIDAGNVGTHCVTGQYGAGASGGQPVPGYAQELGHASGTETFVAIKANIDNWRWQGVPFYLRTGKRLPSRASQIVIQFRPVPHMIFDTHGVPVPANKLVIELQPDENVRLMLTTKTPGLDRNGMGLREVQLDIGMDNAFTESSGADTRRRIAYERLLLDLIEGRSTLFVRRDEVEAQWRWVDGIRAALAANTVVPKPYAAGSWGPSAAIGLTERDGVSWHD
ncbi:MAG: glucose-6-phosphate dehydrogenase [Polymorphobacter sp.]